MEDLELTDHNKLYINQSLCRYYLVSNGPIQIKIQETPQPVSIMHTSDLEKLFLDVEMSSRV